MRVLDYEITLQANGVRLAVYTVEIARWRFTVTRPLGSWNVRVRRLPQHGGAPAARAVPNPHTRRRRGFGSA